MIPSPRWQGQKEKMNGAPDTVPDVLRIDLHRALGACVLRSGRRTGRRGEPK
jgi:hypothetical protein